MSKTSVDSNVDAVLPSSGWPGHPDNITLQTALDDLKDFTGGNVVSIDDTASPYTLGLTDNVLLCDATNAGITVNLPAASGADGRMFTFVKVDSSINAITLDGDGAETINGAATNATMDAQYDSMTIVCDGTEWFIAVNNVV